MPDEAALPPKPQVAAERVRALRSDGRLPCTSLVADWLSGKRPACRDAVDAWVGGTALVAVPAETRWWRQRPLPPETPSTDKGAGRAKGVCPPEPPTPLTVAAWAPRILGLVSPDGLGRHQRPERGGVGPHTGNVGHGWAPQPDRVARTPAPPGLESDVCFLHPPGP